MSKFGLYDPHTPIYALHTAQFWYWTIAYIAGEVHTLKVDGSTVTYYADRMLTPRPRAGTGVPSAKQLLRVRWLPGGVASTPAPPTD